MEYSPLVQIFVNIISQGIKVFCSGTKAEFELFLLKEHGKCLDRCTYKLQLQQISSGFI